MTERTEPRDAARLQGLHLHVDGASGAAVAAVKIARLAVRA